MFTSSCQVRVLYLVSPSSDGDADLVSALFLFLVQLHCAFRTWCNGPFKRHQHVAAQFQEHLTLIFSCRCSFATRDPAGVDQMVRDGDPDRQGQRRRLVWSSRLPQGDHAFH